MKINWYAVRAAMKRTKYGRATADDQILFERAWRANPDKYKAVHDEMVQEVFNEVTMVLPREKKP